MLSLQSTLLLSLAGARGALAWGSLGHATVAYIAQNYLDDTVASWAQGVLADKSDSYLANIASWADSYRSTTAGAWSAPLHYIDAQDDPPSSCSVDYDRDCTSAGCSVSAVANYTQRVGDGRLSADHVAEALKFLVHLVGDITQPLHDEAYATGGNDVDVTYQGYSDNLHADWDTYMPESRVGGSSLADAQTWAASLIVEIDAGAYAGDVAAGWVADSDVEDAVASATAWAADANAYVCTVVMPDGAAAITAASDLYPTYYDGVIGTIELQIAKGGYRLADWLNKVYAAMIAKREVVVERDSDVKKEKRALPDLMGRDLLPEGRPKSKAQLAREAMSGDCGCKEGRKHKH